MGQIRLAIIALMALGAFGIGYVTFSAMGKPQPRGFQAYAQGSLSKLRVLDEAPARPTAIFIDPDGFGVTFEDFESKVLLVNLWATWCAPCVDEMPTLAELQRLRGGDRFEVIAISIDKLEEAEGAEEFLYELTRGDIAFYHDPNRSLPFRMGVSGGFPITILYDYGGRELARLEGPADWASEEALALIDAAVGF